VRVEINSHGWRDDEYPYKKPPGTFRILILGDSFVEGFQVPLRDTLAKVLEQKLNKRRRNVKVINAGFGGVGTDYELLFFRREGFKYAPDLVIVGFFVGNDVQDNYRSKGILVPGGSSLAYEKGGFTVRVKQFLAQHSCAYNYFGIVLPRQSPVLAKLAMKLGLLAPQSFDETHGIAQPHYLVLAKRYGQDWEKAWEVTQALVWQLKKEVKARGSKLAVFSIPLREQVCENAWKVQLSRPAMTATQWDVTKPERILGEIMKENKIPFLSLLPYLSEAENRCDLYCAADGHWNSQGHRLAGQVIYRWLVDEGLVQTEIED